jgi:dolichol-phosphate mannosyltransferase
MENPNILILIPTYNESENVERLYREVQQLGLGTDFLFVDDNSPDGTGAILDRLAQENGRLHVLHRSGKMGVGSAHLAGIEWAYARQYQKLITMDSDFSHSPKYILDILKFGDDFDVVVASRYLSQNSLPEWAWNRKFLTRMGHFLTRLVLQMPYDATGAFRLYRIDRIPQSAFKAVISRGYSFFYESLFVLHTNAFAIKEVPVSLPARTYGKSKMRFKDVLKSVELLGTIAIKRLFHPEQYQIAVETPVIKESPGLVDSQSWDAYWDKQHSVTNSLYDGMAAFFRQWIIRPNLDHFIRKHFSPGTRLLHAGCGGGQVDVNVTRRHQVTALDISIKALRIYQKIHQGRFSLLQGDIRCIELPDQSLDGVYNLGVFEHFPQTEILQILGEFWRVLKPGGKAVIFWPPVYSLSVLFLGTWHRLLHLFNKTIQLHPSEISLLESKEQAETLMSQAGFKLIEYSFGIKDLFTQVVLVIEK